MKAVVFKANGRMAVEKVREPKIKDPHDAILRVTSSAICGSDLHMFEGRTDMEKGRIFGHEIMGVIEKIGDAVSSIKKHDRVVLPFNISCGVCFNCCRGFMNACLTTNPDSPGAGYGYADMGPYEGGQAEYVRVPFADYNCLKLPGKPFDKFEDDFLMLADIFPTGYHACEMAMVQPGSTVAIFGAGPVGLLAAHSALIKGASQVFVVDQSEERLNIAKKIGAEPINLKKGKPSEQIFKIRKNNKLIKESLRPGEEKNKGVMCGIDAVGYQGVHIDNLKEENPMSILKELAEVVNAAGSIGIIGVYVEKDPGAPNKNAKEGIYDFPLGEIWSKGITIQTGQCPVKKYNAYLRDLIIAGKANPGMIVSHHISIDDAPEAYELFKMRGTGTGKKYTKVVITFD